MKNKIKAIFDSMDAEADGEVSMDEMGEVLAKIGLELNAEQSTKLFRDMDADGSGSVSFPEFYRALTKADANKNQLVNVFRQRTQDLVEGGQPIDFGNGDGAPRSGWAFYTPGVNGVRCQAKMVEGMLGGISPMLKAQQAARGGASGSKVPNLKLDAKAHKFGNWSAAVDEVSKTQQHAVLTF